MKLQKKSQLYIITALFLCSLVFLLNVRSERIMESTVDFTSIYSNFLTEAKHVINSAIYLKRNMSRDFSNFADEYLEYASAEGINARVFYGIVYDNNIYLANKLDEPVNLTTGTINFILTKDNQSTITKENWLNAEIDSTDYLFNTSRNITTIKFVLKMSHENKTEVRSYG